MTPELRTKVIIKLTNFLNRAPHEHEIINAQTDSVLMGWIRDEEVQSQKQAVEKQMSDIAALKVEVSKK